MKSLSVHIIGKPDEEIEFDIDEDGDLCISIFGSMGEYIKNQDAIKLKNFLIESL